ncbi:MAG: PilT/PilU family type 4a pilus ATPase [Terrimicrobiaceae bacterium]|nr:PilT/PilU family type 4a pilus ATPase [Terrimicrobiaceae bacterium]
MRDLVSLLADAVSLKASDLHVVAGMQPLIRLNGNIAAMQGEPLPAEEARRIVLDVLTESQRARLEEEWELDFALQVDPLGRFRGNAHYSRGALEAAFRHIPETIPELSALGHRPSIQRACEIQRGLVLVTGITGSGKSTTLAAIVKQISETRQAMIITVEDPIEFIFPNSRSVVKQREVGSDTHSFAEALRHVLRQDPDVILVGEMRDLETIRAAITAAETGHLVLGTLHTIDAPKAIDRMVDAFPGDQQPQIIAQLANALEMVIAQRLLPCESGGTRVLASETLVANTAVRACIRDRRYEQLVGLIEIGGREGMNTIDDSLADLYLARRISKEEAIANARDVVRFESLARQPEKKRGLFS